MRTPDPTSFWGRVALSSIDKVLLGMVAGVALYLFQAHLDEQDRREQQVLSVSRLSTGILEDQTATVIASMTEYLAVLHEAADFGRANDAQRLRLRGSTLDVTAALAVAGVAAPVLDDSAAPLIDRMEALNAALEADGREGAASVDLARRLPQLTGAYRDLIGQLRRALIDAAQVELDGDPLP